jgi:drug/metabolite transporter (DMT)-like permease
MGAVVCWALLAPSVILAVQSMDPWLALFFSFLFSSLFLAVATLVSGRRERLLGFLSRQGIRNLALGVYGIAGYHFLYSLAFDLAPRAETNSLNYLWPLLTVLFGMWAERSLFRRRAVSGALVGFAGAVLVIVGGKGMQLDPADALGYACAVAAAVVWASYSVWLSQRKLETISSNFVFNAATCAIAGLYAVVSRRFRLPSAEETLGLVFIGAVPLTGGFLFWQEGLNHGDPTLLGNLSFLIPFLSSLFLYLLTDVALPSTALAGLVLIVLGAWLGIGGRLRLEEPPSASA